MQKDAHQTTPASPELPQPDWREVMTREHLPRLLVLCLAVWLHAANTMLAATTLPEAVGDIGGLRLISWAFALYLMGSIVAATAVSALVAGHGLRRTMLVATLVYTLGCVICASAPMMPMLLAGRTVQGLGGGALVALVFVAQGLAFEHLTQPEEFRTAALWLFAGFLPPALLGNLIAWRFSALIARERGSPFNGK